MCEYQNIKTFLLKAILQIGLRKSLSLKKLKARVINDLNGEEIIGIFYKKNCKK